MGSDPDREAPFFFQKPTDAIVQELVEHAVVVVGQHGIGLLMPLVGGDGAKRRYESQSSDYAKSFRVE